MNGLSLLYEVEQKFDSAGRPRGYLLDEKRVTSVTTALGILDKPALKGWAWRIAVEGSASLPPMRRNFEQQEKALIAAGYGWWQKRNEAAFRGNALHACLQSLLETGEPPDLEEWPEEHQGFVQALASYWVNEQPKVMATEIPVASRQHQYGGRIDLVRGSGKSLTPRPVDFKTSKPDKFGEVREPFLEAHLQVAGYEEALTEQTGKSVASGEIVGLCENGKYEVFPCCADPQKFPLILKAFRYLAETEAAIKKRRKESVSGEAESSSGS